MHRIISFVFALLIAFSPFYQSQAQNQENSSCLRCHGLKTLAVRDTSIGGIRNLHVSKELYGHSIHGELSCTKCHESGYAIWPHSVERSEVSELRCTSCHNDPEKKLKPMFSNIEKEFSQSIHVKKLGDAFSCFSCHDPHSFERIENVTETKISSANAMCLNCHESQERFTNLTKRDFPVLEITHAWLPNQNLHWKSVRCVDCHTSYEAPNMSHNILPRGQAVTKCESCHSENTVLMAKLYKHEHKEAKQRMGFVNGTLLNDAYVIGSTRNPLLDISSFILFTLTFIGIAGHGFLRYRGKKKATKANEDTELLANDSEGDVK